MHEAESVTPRSEGLQFLPYLSGERTPYPDPLARGAFIGLALRHGRGHMTRVVLEGVAFGLKGSFALIKNAKLGEISQIRASGGATNGTLWRRILASVLEADLLTVTSTEGAAYGAALLAGMGAENWSDVTSACRAAFKISGSTRPDTMQVEMYSGSYMLITRSLPCPQGMFSNDVLF